MVNSFGLDWRGGLYILRRETDTPFDNDSRYVSLDLGLAGVEFEMGAPS